MGSLFVDKHRPRKLSDLDYHPELSDRLRALVRPPPLLSSYSRTNEGAQAAGDFPHTLFYGPSGAGKKTRIMAVLRELFGPGVEKVRERSIWVGDQRVAGGWDVGMEGARGCMGWAGVGVREG
jgi:hypothetical protein